MAAEWIDVTTVSDFPPGQRRIVEVDDVLVAVFNLDGEYCAVEDRCSHDNAPLGHGEVEGEQIICPRHGARFCLRTGAALTPPAYEDITVFPVRVQAGMVQVRDNRFD